MFKDKPKFKEYKYQKFLERREWLNNYKLSKGCEMCGYNAHPQALCFDHIDPYTKHPKYDAKQLTRWGMTMVLEEIAKCRVLCMNCHSVHSYEAGHCSINKKSF